jgi:hypothetical protein
VLGIATFRYGILPSAVPALAVHACRASVPGPSGASTRHRCATLGQISARTDRILPPGRSPGHMGLDCWRGSLPDLRAGAAYRSRCATSSERQHVPGSALASWSIARLGYAESTQVVVIMLLRGIDWSRMVTKDSGGILVARRYYSSTRSLQPHRGKVRGSAGEPIPPLQKGLCRAARQIRRFVQSPLWPSERARDVESDWRVSP